MLVMRPWQAGVKRTALNYSSAKIKLEGSYNG